MQNKVYVERWVRRRGEVEKLTRGLPFDLQDLNGSLPVIYAVPQTYSGSTRQYLRTIYLTAPSTSMILITNFVDPSIRIEPTASSYYLDCPGFSIEFNGREFNFLDIIDIFYRFENSKPTGFREALDNSFIRFKLPPQLKSSI